MRELKFRIWDDGAEEFLDETSYHEFNLCDLKMNNLHPDYKIDQYTGLKDKNDVEIYEGDIVRWNAQLTKSWAAVDHDMNGKLGTIVFNSSEAAYKARFSMAEDFTLRYANVFEVVGNIYENPELLEGKNVSN